MEVSNNVTTFENVSGSRYLPMTVSLKLASDIRTKLLEGVSDKEYSDLKASIRGVDLQNRTIDLAQNEQLLEDLALKINHFQRRPATDFILQWADSGGIVISTPKQMRNILGIVQSIFLFNAQVLRMQDNHELSHAFNEAFNNFVALM